MVLSMQSSSWPIILQIAELKHEMHMVNFLSKAANGSAPSQGKAAGAQAAPQKEVPDSDKYL
jgi:hypothetical protein